MAKSKVFTHRLLKLPTRTASQNRGAGGHPTFTAGDFDPRPFVKWQEITALKTKQ